MLFLDNYYSHLTVRALKMLRAANVRVVAMHPHTTHLFCVLDTSVFALFKRRLFKSFDAWDTAITMDNTGGVIRNAYSAATHVTEVAVTKKRTPAAIAGWASTGLHPFSRDVIEKITSTLRTPTRRPLQRRRPPLVSRLGPHLPLCG